MNPVLPERILRYVLEQGRLHQQLTTRLILVGWMMLTAAAVIWFVLGRHRKGYDITSVYWLGCGLGIWLCLFLRISAIIPAILLVIGALSLLFAGLPLWVHHRRQRRAWLRDPRFLIQPFVPPGGLITSITAMSLLVFFLGLCYLTSPNVARSAFAVGAALLMLMPYDYRPESAMAGLVLISLAIVSAFLDLCNAAGQSSPTIVNLAIIPMSCLAFHWIWLGGVWSRQIIDGQPLTTSARLVGLTRHMGVMLLGFSTLLAVKLALWPIMPAAAGNHDDTARRFALIILTFVLLLTANLWIARRLGAVSLQLLAALNLFAAVVALITRFPELFHRVFWPRWQMIALGYCLLALAVIGLLHLRGRRSPQSGSETKSSAQ